jgi:hypothetical protein
VAIRHLHSGPDDRSYVDDLAVPLDIGALGPSPRRVSTTYPARTVQVGYLGPGFEGGWHNVPAHDPYLVAFLGPGTVEIETAGGWRHHFVAGDVLLCTDFAGEGHLTRVIGDHPATNLYIVLEEDAVMALDGSLASSAEFEETERAG